MRKFASNYVLSESGDFLKNGIVIAEDDGSILEYIDTHGKLSEMAQLTFYNGILIANFAFVKIREAAHLYDFDNRFSSLILADLGGKSEVSILDWLKICQQVQRFFPDMMIIEIFNGINQILSTDGGFRKENQPGVYLLTGTDLVILKLSENCRLKRIL